MPHARNTLIPAAMIVPRVCFAAAFARMIALYLHSCRYIVQPRSPEIASFPAGTPRTSMRSRMKPVIALAWLGLVLLGACDKKAPPAAEIRPVRTVLATKQTEGEAVTLTGHIRARTEENLAFRIDGRMLARRVDVGHELRPGDPVADLDPQPQQDGVRTAQAALAAAQASLHEATNNLERQRTLVGQGWSTRVQFDAAEKAFLSAKAAVDSNTAQLHSAEDQLGYTKLLADSSGAVIATGAEAGEVVRAGQMIITVAHGDGADAVFDVPASLMRQVSS